MKSILIFTHNLGFGGVQKNVVKIANALAKKHKITLLLMEDKGEAFALDSHITVSHLPYLSLDIGEDGAGERLFDFRAQALKSFGGGFDLVLALEDYCSILALGALEIRTVVSSRVLPSLYYENSKVHLLDGEFFKREMARLYPNAAAVVSVDGGVASELMDMGIKSVVIGGGVDMQELESSAAQGMAINRPFVLSVGRIDFRQKGQNDLLEAFSLIADEIDHLLLFVGDGPDRAALELLITEKNLEDRAFVTGFDKNPYRYMARCACFVFASYFEGRPNALLEAMALGAPCVSYDFAPSWSSVTDGGNAAVIVPKGQIAMLSQEIKKCLFESGHAQELSRKAVQNAAKFSHQKSMEAWEKLAWECLDDMV